MISRTVSILCVVALGSAACSGDVEEGVQVDPASVSCAAARPDAGELGTWSRAAGLDDREGYERLLVAECGIADPEPASFASYDQDDGQRTLGLHLQTFCQPFEVAVEEEEDVVSVWVRTTAVEDLTAVCAGDYDARLGTYVVTLAGDLGDRKVLPG